MSTAPDVEKAARGAERARQAAHKATDRQKARSPRSPGSKRGGGGGGRPALNLDDDDHVDSGDDAETETEKEDMTSSVEVPPPVKEREVPLEPFLERARVSRKDTADSFEVIRPPDRGVVALEDSVELPGPGADGWERVEAHEAIERPTYSDAASGNSKQS
ncbi:hypothetical protein EXIGLDRAFT_745266 [Exidia glandulosa HHB12029]|uniref:Uncharacterized protein n=1 Tax=Exidia glandulosa HHB12029 TaxID=1314781 RepID=A0A166BH76_EXIGL|nr:hypothetical protein EXIGLDRAFT_745266 [Exidia glandulosa HHB12029]